ncbi:MAG: GAF domain-containing protein [Lachnospiraceae bacterium]|nr:GAF domain-containing protein [Lachnospiraceae bacterium]
MSDNEFRNSIGETGYTLDRMIRIALDLSAENDFDILMQKILLEAMDICHCDAGTVYVLEEDHLYFHTVLTKSLGTSLEEQNRNKNLPPVPLGRKNVCACAALDKKRINIPDVYESKDYDFTGAQKYDAITHYRTGSMLVIPMDDDKDDIIGVLQLINAQDENGRTIPFDPAYEQIISALASLAAVSLNNHQLAQEVTDTLHSFVEVMVDAIDARSAYNANHTRSMVRYAGRFIDWLKETGNPWTFTDDQRDAYLMSIWLHDIGKLVVPLEVLDKPDRLGPLKSVIKSKVDIACLMEKVESLQNPDRVSECNAAIDKIRNAYEVIEKANTAGFLPDERIEELKGFADIKVKNAEGEEIPLLDEKEIEAITIRKGTLTDSERQQVQSHVVYTRRMLDKMHFKGIYKEVPFWSGSHHEFLNGRGYPNGLSADDLPDQSRLLTIIDVYDALTAEDRPYKPPMPPEKAFEILRSMRDDGQIDGKLLDEFVESGAWKKEE